MLKNAGLEFGRVLSYIGQIEIGCANARKFHPESRQIDDETKIYAGKVLILARQACILGNLEDVLPEISRFELVLASPLEYADVQNRAANLKQRLFDELKNEFYLQVDRAEVQFYGQDALFGADVATKLKDATYDVKNAGNCLALQQPTACVLHLQRAMESALRQMGSKLKVKINPKDTWGAILNNIDPKIKAMPEKTEIQKRKRERWAEARANLFHVKQAWRDNSMHGKQRYDRPHAYSIFMAVRAFMTHLASL
jgi:hypothetical protein